MPPHEALLPKKVARNRRLVGATRCHAVQTRASGPQALNKKKINIDVHAVLHVIVENMIVLNDPPERAVAVERMVSEGLDRHDALHAAAVIVARHLPDYDDLTADRMDEALNQALASDIAELNRTVYE